jgi:glycosyltransferase involved in cell wall biosynthesis
MRIAVVHADYLEPGGETVSARAEARTLQKAGHEVFEYVRSNRDFVDRSWSRQAADLIYNREVRRELENAFSAFRPEVVHCNNLFPSLSPSVYYAATSNGAALVQTLRNYRVACPPSTFFRDGAPCYDCLGKRFASPGVRHACYRGSHAASAGVATMTALHRAIGTRDMVDAYILLSRRSEALLAKSGLPVDRFHVKYNVVDPVPEPGLGDGDFFVFVGRLTPEKGVGQLLEAARSSPLPVHVVGNGPLGPLVARAAEQGLVRWTPYLEHPDVLTLMGRARATLALPQWDEPFGRTVAESLAAGTPVVCTAAGALPELVQDGRSGRCVAVGDAAGLRRALVEVADLSPAEYASRRRAARSRYEAILSSEAGTARLESIYAAALEHRRSIPKRQRRA